VTCPAARRPFLPIVCSVRTPRLLLRAWQVSDAPRLREAIIASLEHLQRWLYSARHYPEPLEKMQTDLRRWRRRALAGEMLFAIFSPDEREIIGSVGSHRRIGEGASEIGYWIHAAHVRHGYASEAAAALVKTHFEMHGLRRLEIHTDPTNAASCGVALRLGFSHQATIRACVLTPDGPIRDDAVFALTRSAYADTPAARLDIEATDRRGSRVG
jgi:RimJ/RimL family protein N-acetyltransferase